MDAHDALIDCCDMWKCYPCNLLRPTRLQSTLENYRQRLDESEKRLFSAKFEAMSFFELDDGEKCEQAGSPTARNSC